MRVDVAHGEKSGDGPWPEGATGVAPATSRAAAPQAEDHPFRAVGFMVSSIGYAAARRFRETLAPLALEPREFALLRVLGAAEGLSQQAAAERLQIPPSRMVAFVDALEARALLERRHNPVDRRTRELYLTAAGRELLGRAFELASELERQLCAQLNTAERELLLDLLQRVSSQLGLTPGVHAHSALAHE